MRTLATHCAIFLAAFLVFALPIACITPDAIACVQSIHLQDIGAGLAMLTVGIVAKCPEAREKEIRKEKSPKKLRENVELLNKEIQKHRDMINADTYEWRQEDENKLNALFGERQVCIERAEFLETLDDVADRSNDLAAREAATETLICENAIRVIETTATTPTGH